jgi:hypothetical protein
MTPLLLTLLGSAFGEAPNQQQVELGRKLARQYDRDHWQRQLELPPNTGQLASIVEVYRDDRRVLGTWSEGIRKLDVEWAIRLSPELMSRWLGFMSEREAWGDGELDRRWNSVKQQIGDRPVFMVLLSAFPRKERLGLGETFAPSTDEIDNIRVVFEQKGRRIEASAYEVWRQRAETRSELDQVPWWQFTRLKDDLTSMFDKGYEPPIIQRGDYYRTWTWVTPASDVEEATLTLKIVSKRKVRETTFEFPAICDIAKG